MITVQASSLRAPNAQQRSEKIKNDLKYSWAAGTTAGLGTAAAFVGYAKPELYTNGFNKVANIASTQWNKLTNSSVGKKAIEIANKIKNSAIFGKIQAKAQPALTAIGKKLGGLKTEMGKLGKTVSSALSKIPTNYKIAGAIAAVTLALVNNLAHKHAYNEGKIDGRYEK